MTKTFEFRTVRRAPLKNSTGLGDDYIEKEILGKRPEGIYWFRTPGSTRILYNLDLIKDWLVNGHCPAHEKAVKRYLASLPSSDVT
jgi:hypothetical protein